MALIHYNFNSEALGAKTDVSIILPDVCWEAAGEQRKYQSLYLLHGGGEDYTSYIRYTNIETWAGKHKLAVIMPDGGNSSYMNMAHGQNYYSYISEELPLVMQHVFPLSKSRKDHFAAGFSMGAAGTLHWVFDRPDFFKAAAVMSGGCDFEEATKYIAPGRPEPEDDIFHCAFGGIDKIRGSAGDVYLLAEKMAEEVLAEQRPQLFSVVGKEDFMYYSCFKFKKYLDGLGIDMEFHTGEGGHTWEFWNLWLPRILEWFDLAGTLVEEGGESDETAAG